MLRVTEQGGHRVGIKSNRIGLKAVKENPRCPASRLLPKTVVGGVLSLLKLQSL